MPGNIHASAVSMGLFEPTADCDYEAMLAALSAAERARHARIRHPRRAAEYAASRWLLRAHLGWRFGVAPATLPIEHARNRRPRLRGRPWYLALSHSDGLCLCLVSPLAAAGCDIERQRPRASARELAARYFHPTEAAALAADDDETTAQEHFYRLWSLKEAATKSRGRIAAPDLRTPAFVFDPVFRCIEAPAPGQWSFATATHVFRDHHYSLAFAIAARTGTWPHVYRHVPGATDAPVVPFLSWVRASYPPAERK